MQTAEDLRNLLSRIDRKSYPAYKDTRGAYQFQGYVLSIDHVQGDPFAAPSRVSVRVPARTAGFPPALYQTTTSAWPSRTPSPAFSGGRRARPPSRPRGRGTAGS